MGADLRLDTAITSLAQNHMIETRRVLEATDEASMTPAIKEGRKRIILKSAQSEKKSVERWLSFPSARQDSVRAYFVLVAPELSAR